MRMYLDLSTVEQSQYEHSLTRSRAAIWNHRHHSKARVNSTSTSISSPRLMVCTYMSRRRHQWPLSNVLQTRLPMPFFRVIKAAVLSPISATLWVHFFKCSRGCLHTLLKLLFIFSSHNKPFDSTSRPYSITWSHYYHRQITSRLSMR